MILLENSWDELLKSEFESDYYLALREKLKKEYRQQTVYPDMNDIFTALKLTPWEEVKVVILGQDPYFNPGQAHGLSFSVKKGVAVPPSLQNIYKEIHSELGCSIPRHGDLSAWAEQGVLLLNASLTVRAGQPNSHQTIGWERFTDRVVELVNDKDEPVVFLLWGANAMKKARMVDRDKHLVLTSAHPSPLSASRGFFGCNHFKAANEFLMEHYGEAIDWQIREEAQ